MIQIRQNHVERKNIYKKTEALRKVADGLYGENALGLALYMSRESLEGDFFWYKAKAELRPAKPRLDRRARIQF